MVNHVATWLLNAQPGTGVLDGEFFIEPGFQPTPDKNFSSYLLVVRGILFPTTDRTEKFRLMNRYLTIIRYSYLFDQLTEKDTRITTEKMNDNTIEVRTDNAIGLDVGNLLEDLQSLPQSFFTDERRKTIWGDYSSRAYDRVAALLLETAYQTEKASRSTVS